MLDKSIVIIFKNVVIWMSGHAFFSVSTKKIPTKIFNKLIISLETFPSIKLKIKYFGIEIIKFLTDK